MQRLRLNDAPQRILLLCCLLGTIAGSAWARESSSIAVIGFQTTDGATARDAWLITAVEESLSRRLRRASNLRIVPPVRLHLAQRELQDPGAPVPGWDRVTRLLGVNRIISGSISGYSDRAKLTVQISGAQTASQTFGPAPLLQVLDQATLWLFQQFGVNPPPPKSLWQLEASSASPLEYYAKAVLAARGLSTADALFYLERAEQFDGAPRSVGLMLAEVQLRLGPSTRQQAITRLRNLLKKAAESNDKLAQIETELTYANAQLADGLFDAAEQRQRRALNLARGLGDTYAEIAARNALADTNLRREAQPDPSLGAEEAAAFRRTALQDASEQLLEVLSRLESIGDLIGQAPLTNKLALIYERLRQPAPAGQMHQRTLSLARQTGSRRTEATALIFLGQWHQAQGDIASAQKSMEACLQLAPTESRPKVHIALADVLRDAGQFSVAQQHYESAYRLLEEGEDLLSQMLCLERIARILEQQGRQADARRRWQEALDIAEVLELPDAERLRKEVNK